jgi:tight adherence protein B
VGVWLAVALTLWAVTLAVWWAVWRAARTAEVGRMKERLLGAAKEPRRKKRSRRTPALIKSDEAERELLIQRLLRRFRYDEWARRLLEQAGLKWKPARLAHACLALLLAGYWAAGQVLPARYRWLALALAVGAGTLPLAYVYRQRRTRLMKFEALFPESLEFVARSMRAGHAFSVSLEMLHREFPEPLAGEFRRTFEEHNLGLPLETALVKLSERVPSMDVHFFVSAVLLQRRTGGNLAEILDKLASLIRERFKLRGKIRAISAHGRMTGLALSLIPVVVALLLFYLNPDYARFFFTDPVGQMMAAVAIALQLVGYAVIKKIVAIEI